MAKVKNPFLSIMATGTFAGIMTANRGKQTQVMRSAPLRRFDGKTKKQISEGTPAQAIRRAIMRDAITAWQNLPDPQKAIYNTRAKPIQMSGYNLFCREWLNNPPTQPGTDWDGGTTVWDNLTTIWDF